MGLVIIPIEDGKPYSEEKIMGLSLEEKEALMQKQQGLQAGLEATLRQARLIDKNAEEALSKRRKGFKQ